jgi:F-type H+-transporting ATPase subunit delta
LASESTAVSGIAERYAGALYDLADEQNVLDQTADDLRGLATMLDDSDDFRRLIRSPVISKEDQAGAANAVVEKAGAADLVRRFIGAIAANRRLFALPTIITSFLDLLATRRGIVRAQVTSAHALSESQRQELSDALKASMGNEVSLDVQVNPALIGGLIVRVGSRMIDSSLKTKLERLQLAMKGVG